MNIAGVLLAAGASTRLGFPKQLLKIEGETLVRRAARALLAAGCRPVIVVVGANSERVIPELTGLPITTVHNSDWQTGMAQSIHAGLTAAARLDPQSRAILIALCDQPRITADDLLALTDLFKSTEKPIAAAAYGAKPGETLGVPAIFDRALFPDLLALTGEAGARKVISAYRDEVAPFTLPAAALDVDLEADLARAGITPDASTCDASAPPSRTPR